MPQYLYILSNPSMPGLVKIGKTSTSPDRRMAELQSTGVPTPFILEASLEVNDADKCESSAHRALSKFRVSRNREFFKVSVRDALRSVLPVIGDYKIHDVQSSHGIAEIEQELKRRRRKAELEEQRRTDEIRRREEEERRKREGRISEIERSIASEVRKLEMLGARPVKKELPGVALVLCFAYLPIPIGWLFWLGTLRIFDDGGESVGLFCIGSIIAGYLANRLDNKYRTDFERSHEPFDPIDARIYELQSELDELSR